MTQNTYQLSLTFEQILTLVRQLPRSEQIKLTKEISQNIEGKTISSRTETFKHLIEQVQPVSEDFDPQQTKENYLNEKYSL